MQNSPVCILLHAVKYGDKSIILKTLHKEGIRSYFVHNFLKKSKNKYPFLNWPLSVIEIEERISTKSKLPIAKNLSLAFIPKNISYDIMKQSVALFMADVLFHFVKEENDGIESIYTYVLTAIKALDKNEQLSGYFPVKFGYDMADILGYGIYLEKNNETFFNHRLLHFQHNETPECFNSTTSEIFKTLLSVPIENINEIRSDRAIARQLFQQMLQFFKNKIPESGHMKSPQILNAIYK